jgi:alpha-L-fucosidase 2
LSKLSKELGKESEEYDKIIKKLDDIAITSEGVVMLNKENVLPFSHRHFSHLMCLYPLHIINYDTELNKKIYEQSMLQIEQLGTGWWVGFSFPVCAQLYAMMYNGNAA